MKHIFFLVAFFFINTVFCQPCINISLGHTYCGQNNGSASLYTLCCGDVSEASWSNGASGTSVSNLAPGLYEVYVETFGGCGDIINFEILPSDPMPLATSFENTTCGINNGSATIVNLDTLSGFSPVYSWSNGSSQSSISNLSPGLYVVTVYEFFPTGGEACIEVFSFDIQPSSEISGSIDVSHTTCNLPNGSLTALATGGGSSHTYAWSTGQTTSTISNLIPNTYYVTIHSSDGCTPLTLSEVVAPSTSISGSVMAIHTTCNLPNGSMEAMASGGGPNHTYLWSNGQTTSTISNIAAGDYSVIIHSSDGCSPLTISDKVNKSSALVAVLDVTQTSCGYDNGSLSADANHPNTAYLWNTGASAASIYNLSAGTYTVTATDGNGCISSASAVINPSQGFELSVELVGISLEANTQIFTLYEWLDCSNFTPVSGADDKIFTPPAVGTYAVAVHNGNLNGISCRDTSDCIEYLIAGVNDDKEIQSWITCASIQSDHIELSMHPQISVRHIKIIDANGVMITCPISWQHTNCQIDASSFPPGLIFIQCFTDKGVIAKRVIKI